jgi:hypothetical protein
MTNNTVGFQHHFAKLVNRFNVHSGHTKRITTLTLLNLLNWQEFPSIFVVDMGIVPTAAGIGLAIQSIADSEALKSNHSRFHSVAQGLFQGFS